jgi:hypothetical protein
MMIRSIGGSVTSVFQVVELTHPCESIVGVDITLFRDRIALSR